MPIHNWSRVPSGPFHVFHQTWTIYICTALNAGILPKNLPTLVEPKSRQTYTTAKEIYAGKANRIVVKHHLGRTVAVVEIVSPGNKNSKSALRDFLGKTLDFLKAGVHVLLVDLFPPTPRDPLGLHQLSWDELGEESFACPAGKDRIVASYEAGREKAAYVEPIAVGDSLPEVPLFVAEGMHVKLPLEATYVSAWAACPEAMREAVETGVLPDPDAEE